MKSGAELHEDYYQRFTAGEQGPSQSLMASDEIRQLSEALKYLKERLKDTESELFKERKAGIQFKTAAAQFEAEKQKYFELSIRQQKQIIALRKENSQSRQSYARALADKSREIVELRERLEEQRASHSQQQEAGLARLRVELEQKLQAIKDQWFKTTTSTQTPQPAVIPSDRLQREHYKANQSSQKIQLLERKIDHLQQSFNESKMLFYNPVINKSIVETASKSSRPKMASSRVKHTPTKKVFRKCLLRNQKEQEKNKPTPQRQSQKIERVLQGLKAEYLRKLNLKGSRESLNQLMEQIQQQTREYVLAKNKQSTI